MHLIDVLNKCKERGYPISKQGLYSAGIKNGFLTKSDGKTRWDFNKDKFLEWLDKAIEEIPEGWITIKEIPERFPISIATAYLLIRNEDCGARTFGAGKGVLYVDPKRIEEIIRKREERNKENWDE